MLARRKAVWKEGLVGKGKGHKLGGCNGCLDGGDVHRYNEPGYENVLVYSVMCEKVLGSGGQHTSICTLSAQVRIVLGEVVRTLR